MVHQQIQAVLHSYIPDQTAHVLVVGCGTGYELGYLLKLFPDWRFTAIDLSANMLEQAQAYIQQFNPGDRVRFVQGEISQLDHTLQVDAILSILVTHFIAYADKPVFFQQTYQHLKPGGIFITFDMTQIESEQHLKRLKYICESNGLAPAQAEAMLKRLTDDFFALSEAETHQFLRQAGFKHIERFTQIFCYQGFMAIKEVTGQG